MKELQRGLEGVREEITCIGKSVEGTNRSVMEVVINMMTMLKKGQEDELRDNRDDIREEEGRRANSIMGTVQRGGNPIEEYVGFDNQYNDMKIDKDCFSDGNDKLSGGEIGGEDDNPLNLVNLKGLLHDIETAFEKQSSESSGEFNRARIA
ncbi:hypothetical protein M9H77_17020 [Catharanthus roseus]|uniref:Uncharacterized protein n=1 Tax=Catharanthus roseus TaxID=4058 RepID=A0ACC0B3E3_CATRO|nr:hypothetical protein M9H77_17020 [Catharanthus roseus]